MSARKANYQVSIKAANAVVCVSESVRSDVLENFEMDVGRVVTLPNILSGASLARMPDRLVKRVTRRLELEA